MGDLRGETACSRLHPSAISAVRGGRRHLEHGPRQPGVDRRSDSRRHAGESGRIGRACRMNASPASPLLFVARPPSHRLTGGDTRGLLGSRVVARHGRPSKVHRVPCGPRLCRGPVLQVTQHERRPGPESREAAERPERRCVRNPSVLVCVVCVRACVCVVTSGNGSGPAVPAYVYPWGLTDTYGRSTMRR
jgi:hypothetical protein